MQEISKLLIHCLGVYTLCICMLKRLNVFLKKNILWMKTINYPNKIRSHLIGHNRTNGAVYPKIKSEIYSALQIFDNHPTLHFQR